MSHELARGGTRVTPLHASEESIPSEKRVRGMGLHITTCTDAAPAAHSVLARVPPRATLPALLTLELRAEPSDVPVEVRLRRSLKYLLRACQLRCVSIVPAVERGDRLSPDSRHP